MLIQEVLSGFKDSATIYLPNMEKQYWFFVENEPIEKVKNGKEKIFVALYFEHKVATGKSGYGMISEYHPKGYGFVHSDMWIVNPEKNN